MQLPELSGPRVRLTAIDGSGADDMFEYSRDARFYRHLEYPPHKTREDAAAYLAVLQARSARDDAYYWFIRLKSTERVIGTIGLHHIDWRKQSGEVGYGISPAYWGRGYFAETLRMVLAHAFGELGFHRVAATTPRENDASVRALVKEGFVHEGVLRDYYLSYDGRRYDAAVLSLLQPHYLQQQTEQIQERSVASGDDR